MFLKIPKIGKTWGELSLWHKWFAWYPVIYKNNFIWLEIVKRSLVIKDETNYFVYKKLNK